MVSKPVSEPKAQDVRIESVTMKYISLKEINTNCQMLTNVKPEGFEEKSK